MSKLKQIREQHNLTQEELSDRSGISVRTIQRIEAGTDPKGYTLKSLAKALELSESDLLSNKRQAKVQEKIEKAGEKETENPEESVIHNFSKIKLINLSSILFVILPPLNILVPLILTYTLKERNFLTKQIISVQIIWTISAPIIFMSGIFLKLGRQFTLIVMILIVLSNIFIILRNAAEIDRKKKLYYKLSI